MPAHCVRYFPIPSFDVYSDIAFSYRLFNEAYKPDTYNEKKPTYGGIMLIPVALATLFMIPHWWREENTLKKRICTLPLLILQLWPQWKVLKIIKLMWNKDKKWKYEKEKLDREVSSLGIIFSILLLTVS